VFSAGFLRKLFAGSKRSVMMSMVEVQVFIRKSFILDCHFEIQVSKAENFHFRFPVSPGTTTTPTPIPTPTFLVTVVTLVGHSFILVTKLAL
jgi:hypothetical protein